MAWTAQQIRFRLLSPMHIGWRKSGNLQQTRPYVTGCALWGALTARLAREAWRANNEAVGEWYKKVGEWVDERLAFTYFYPSDCPDRVRLWPWEESWDEFAWTYLGSYVSTSLADGHAAEEGSLHETEFIAPRTRDDNPVYLLGYIFQREDWRELALDLDAALNKLQIGGERGYGWGRLALCKEKNSFAEAAGCFQMFEFDTDANADRPVLTAASDDARLPAHALPNSETAAAEIEPLLGRLTDKDGRFGQSPSKADICWKPGKPVSSGDRFSIERKGLWKKVLQ
jgi:hypothetical protein